MNPILLRGCGSPPTSAFTSCFLTSIWRWRDCGCSSRISLRSPKPMIASSVCLYLMRYASLLATCVCMARKAQHLAQLPAHPIHDAREA